MKFLSGILPGLLVWPCLLLAETAAGPDDRWQICPLSGSGFYQYSPPPVFADDQKDATRISATRVESSSTHLSTFSGNVLIERDGLRLQADHIIYNKPEQTVDIDSKLHIDAENLAVDADHGWLDLQNRGGIFDNAHYQMPASRFQGSTPRLTTRSGDETVLVNSLFSSCPPGQEDWYLQTSLLRLDHASDTGTASHAVLWFKHVPLFYSPWLQFPLGDERRSGFLMPGFATSGSRGFEISVPWYWNIAPNQDALFTARHMNLRGTLLNTDYRYLLRGGKGEAQFDYLPEDEQTLDSRYRLQYAHHADISQRLSADLDINDVSDDRYFDDLENDTDLGRISHLQRKATLNYTRDIWRADLNLQSYETIDPNITLDNYPYKRLPQISMDGSNNIGRHNLLWSLHGELTHFAHDSDTRPTGQRFDIYPKLSWPLQGHAWFVTPTAGSRYTQYSLKNGDDTPLELDARQITVTSLDSGLFFEREFDLGFVQTLEPRLFYLNIPYEDQSAIPLFDTGNLDFSFSQLFRENRFNGIDRIGDTRQLTTAITSRLLDRENGDEFLSISAGQIFYDFDRRVTLDNTAIADTRSDILAEASAHIGDWRLRNTVQWDGITHEGERRNLLVQYRSDNRHIFNIGYRYLREGDTETLEQTDLALVWPLSKRYTLLSRWNYSITEESDIDMLTGVEYESCCWAMRLLARRFLQDDNSHDSSVMLQLIFKGLGSAGDKKASQILESAILGYQSDDK
ncbi:MAG: LPS-assembly protein [Pseudomonadota bacterium]|nr:LPS-assembly protein [Pseudomonadota bacterium]